MAARAGWLAALAALAAGFGVGTLVILVQPAMGIWVAALALIGGVALGWAWASQPLLAAAGVCLGLFGWTVATLGLVRPVAGENDWLEAVPILLVPILAMIATAGMLPAIFLTRRARATRRVPGLLATAIGLGAVGAYALTLGVLAYAPSSASFEIPLPAGWHAIPREETAWTGSLQLGGDFTAVYGTRGSRWSGTVPLIGVTVVGDDRDTFSDADPALQCYYAVDTWGRSDTPLYDGERLSPPVTVELPAGTAHAEVRAVPDEPGVIVYGYGLARTRLVGALPEQSCYILAITVPPGGPITEADARSIAESLRFR